MYINLWIILALWSAVPAIYTLLCQKETGRPLVDELIAMSAQPDEDPTKNETP